MTQTLSATEVDAHFLEVAERVVDTGERVVVELAGRGRLVMIAADELERMSATHVSDDPIYRQLADIRASVESTTVDDWLTELRELQAAFRESLRGSTDPINAAELVRMGRDDYEDWLAWNQEHPETEASSASTPASSSTSSPTS